jgi:hypothetical protein
MQAPPWHLGRRPQLVQLALVGWLASETGFAQPSTNRTVAPTNPPSATPTPSHPAGTPVTPAAPSGATAKDPAVVPPKVLDDPGVAYPKEAWLALSPSRVAVSLLLVVGADGKVEEALLDGAADMTFGGLALAQARRIRFTPATRAQKPIRSKVRYVYTFVAPPTRFRVRAVDATTLRPIPAVSITATATGGIKLPLKERGAGWQEGEQTISSTLHLRATADGYQPIDTELTPSFGEATEVTLPLAPAPLAESQLKRREPPIEVTVWGEKLAPTVKTLTRQEVRELPGAFGDPFRAIEMMPGVTPLISGLPFFYVRGAPPGNVGYFLDGIRVPYLYHLMLGPSVVHPGLIDRVDLYPGGYPARLGRFSGGVVAAVTTPARPELHGEANLRLFDAGALVESGFADGKGTALVGGRYSYTAALFSAVSPEIGLDYHDYQLRVGYALTPTDRLSLFSFGSYDHLTNTEHGDETSLFKSAFYRLSVRYDHRTRDGGVRVSVTPGYDESLLDEEGVAKVTGVGARADTEQRLDSKLLLREGVELQLDENRVEIVTNEYELNDTTRDVMDELFPSRTDTIVGLYADCVWEASPGLEITPGLRLDFYHFGSNSAVAVEPRLSAAYTVSPRVRIIHAFGLAHQPPSFLVTMPGLNRGDIAGGLQQSAQLSSGVEVELAQKATATGTVFYNAFFDMTDAIGTSGSDTNDEDILKNRALGRAVGLELSLKRPLTSRLGGYASYTLSSSTRSLGREHFPSSADRTHVLNAALAYNLGRSWRAGTRATLYTGIPVTFASNNGSEDLAPTPMGTAYVNNGRVTSLRTMDVDRTEPFFRLDLRAEKRWVWEGGTWLSFIVEVMNATLNKEMIGDEEIGPITVPSIGLEGGL